MSPIRKLYLDFYIFVYALYAYFNKGIAYTYLSEILLLVGILFMLKHIRKLEIVWTTSFKLILVFLFASVLYIARGIGKYPMIDVIRDSFMLNYAGFVLILLFFKDDISYLKKGFSAIYKWYPLVALCSFLLLSYIPFFNDFVIFGKVPLLLYKYNDMGVHLLIFCILSLYGNIQTSTKHSILNSIIVIYLILVVAAYNRSGMLAFIIGIAIFYFYSKNNQIKLFVKQHLKYLPILMIVAVALYASTKTQENFQGRKVGLDQLKDNAVSIFSSEKGGTLEGNKVWRLTWWAKIIDDTFTPNNILIGRGYGMSMAAVDDIVTEDDTLRSPHNFHINILGRFGLPIFALWIYWMFLILRIIFKKNSTQYTVSLLAILAAFIFNASLDVYFEGPMGAMPFWTFVGLFYVNELVPEPTEPILA